MKKSLATSLVCVVAAMFVVSGSPSAQSGVPLVFDTTFNCPDWNQGLGLGDAQVCGSGDGIAGNGAWTTSSGSQDQITAAANNAAGAGGKGFRHWRGDGYNNTGGGIRIAVPVSMSNFWIRYYMRYQAGFSWQNGRPGGTKENYWHAGTSKAIYFGFGFGVLRFVNNGNPYNTSITWNDIMGGSASDGQWHLIEYHVQADTNGSNGVGEVWVDGVKVFNRSDVNWNRGPWDSFVLGSNEETPTNGQDMYTDYDDLAVSTVGRIGPVGGSTSSNVPTAPLNLRIIP